MTAPKCIGILSAQQAKGRKAFSFSYDANWISSQEQFEYCMVWWSAISQWKGKLWRLSVFYARHMGQNTNETAGSIKCKRAKNDTINTGAWEYLAYRLAIGAGIDMTESRAEHIAGPYHTFFTKRFDRERQDRIHFASAMTMTGKNEELIRDETPSYLDIVEFIQFSGMQIEEDLRQLWRRMVFNIFNILISNTDDHLRNHGFILTNKGWRL
jgi:hypothetical protein